MSIFNFGMRAINGVIRAHTCLGTTTMAIKSLSSVVLAIGLMLFSASVWAAEEPAIQNDLLRVTADGAGSFKIEALLTKKVVATGKLEGASGLVMHQDVKDATFGDGERLAWPRGSITLFSKLPFALIRSTLHNDARETKTINHVPLVSFDVNLGQPAAKLKTLGTGGLLSPDKNPGSYTFLAVAEPESRNAVVAGWLTQDRASGVLFSNVNDDKVTVSARSDYGRFQLAPGKSAETETLAIGYFDDGRLGLEAYADTVAKFYNIKLPPQPSGFCTWYAEKPYGGSSNEKNLKVLNDFVAKNLKPFGFNFVQIDDGWQLGEKKNGPKKNFTSFNPSGPYKDGMKAAADNIKSHGLRPGIWFMPFAGTHDDPWYANHQDWFVKGEDGKPFDLPWGGTCLDMTNPEVRDYVREEVARIGKEWGYTYFKLDGLYTGMAAEPRYVTSSYKDDKFGNAVFHDLHKTNVEAYRDGLKLVRESAGPGLFILGCNTAQNMRTLGASFGLIEAMRIGPDNKGDWKTWSSRSPVSGSRFYFFNGRVWYNDPDPNYERSSIDLEDARTIASWSAISGQLNSNSDWIPNLPAERIELLKRTMQAHGKTARPVDFFEHDPPRIWVVTDEAIKDRPRRDVVALFNWSDQEAEIEVPISKLGLPKAKEYAAFDYWADQLVPTVQEKITARLPKHGCQILAVRPMEDHPFVISTSRHVTQGMLDIVEEKWDGAERTLSGKSNLIGGDPYILSIVIPGRPLQRITLNATSSSVLPWSILAGSSQ